MSTLRSAIYTAIIAAGTLLAGSAIANAKSIAGVAQDAGQFNTLLTAAKAAGLADVLSSPGHYTVFAPTDAAFAKLPKGTVESLLKPENKGKLRALLKYHVVGKRILAKDIPQGRTHVRTLNGRFVSVRKHGGVGVNNATVTSADVLASNGVIHVVNRVLLPR